MPQPRRGDLHPRMRLLPQRRLHAALLFRHAGYPATDRRGYSIPRAPRGRTADGYIAYLQSYSNTYAPVDELARIYARALSHPSVAGLIIGTRPDTVDDEKLDMIAGLARHRYAAIEYGIESTCDATLDALGRGHDFAASRRAVEAAASRGIAVGGHFILGLPGEDSASILHGTADIARMPLSSIKLHRLQILRSTPLEALWLAEPQRFVSWTAEQYIDLSWQT